jgi:hypothetical protein
MGFGRADGWARAGAGKTLRVRVRPLGSAQEERMSFFYSPKLFLMRKQFQQILEIV